MRAVVVGGGSWGSVFSVLLAARGHDVVLACRDREQARAIRETGRNPRYVRGLHLDAVRAEAFEDAPLREADLIAVAVPSRAFRNVIDLLPDGEAPVLSLVKGLDPGSGERLSQVVDGRPVAALSGPNHAEEIADGLPAAAVIASEDEDLGVRLQHELISPRFRVYVNTDLVGVELCAAAKNVIALGAGVSDGLGMGDNAKAALMTRGLAEMARLGDAAGARPETFAGLAGMGDLIVTCWSRHSRNLRAGELIAAGKTPEEAEAEIAMAVEGIPTAPVLRGLAHRLGIELPITESVCEVLAGEKSPREAGPALMERKPTGE
jgi:glycerol-3-phosphate dehydrogenase (NAD(P)+)